MNRLMIDDGDEKWITYDKNVGKISWSKGKQAPQPIAEPGLTRNKLMLSLRWDLKGIIHYELLTPGKTRNNSFRISTANS
ncbi:Histone-lysine N-methyltransferase SETMAR [Eumeta japonica]|uniref:Histone-lysine N-methyltransferase SETMAR n=1 Tax=Eumeta variegata TaxID=151549 RepID=A0A4C1Z5D0_EUMVA|nr:Histone-lysine N-methyltransferase SETMAR [Eumeta japonica]